MIKFKLLNERAIMPQRGTTGAAGFDLFCTERVDLAPKQRMLIPTGVACALPAGYVGQIWPRSGLAVRHGLDTLAGVIDEDYRGEIHISMINHGDTAVEIRQGEKIAQMLVVPYIGIAAQVDDLDSTERGSSGFGSTGRTAVESRECQTMRSVPERKAVARTQEDVQQSWAERSGQDLGIQPPRPWPRDDGEPSLRRPPPDTIRLVAGSLIPDFAALRELWSKIGADKMQTLQANSGQLAELQTHGYARLRCKQWDAPCRDDNVIVGDIICHVLMIADDPHGDETAVSVRIGEKPHAPR